MLQQVERREQVGHPLLLGEPTDEEGQRAVEGQAQLDAGRRRVHGGRLVVGDPRRDHGKLAAGMPIESR